MRSKCKGGSSISRGPTDGAPGGGGEGAEPARRPPPPWDVTEGRAAPPPARPRWPPPAASAPQTRPARGERAEEGRQLPARPPPVPASSEPPAEILRVPRARGPVMSQSASLKSDEESTVAQNRATSPPHSSQPWPNSPRALGCAVWASGRGEALRPAWGSGGSSPGAQRHP